MNSDIESLRISEMQNFLGDIFKGINQKRSPYEILALLLASFGILNKAVRTNNPEVIKLQSASVFAWICALCNKLSIELEKIFWNHYPGVCPYCCKSPCDPLEHLVPKERRNVTWLSDQTFPGSIRELQLSMKRIYLGNTLADSTAHLVEEIAEVASALVILLEMGTAEKSKEWKELELEIADCLANLFAVANCAGFDLVSAVLELYGKGCHACGRSICSCTKTVIRAHSVPVVPDDEP